MTEPGGVSGLLRDRLPNGWHLERMDDGTVCGATSEGGAVRAAFAVGPTGGDLWAAAWWGPLPRNRRCEGREPARVTGIRERCAEWVAERATTLEDGRDG